MKKIWVGLWFALQVCSLWSLDVANGQAQVGSVVGTVTDNNVTANLITSPLSPVVNATAPEGYSGGSSVGYNATTNTYYFGYTQQTIGKTIAINNALQGSGVQVNGVQYGMSYLNGANSYGTLAMNVAVTSNTGAVLNSYNHTFNTQNPAWQQFDQTQTFTNPYTLANLGNVSMSITGKDSRFWAGYYGPQVKDPYLKLTYGADPKTYYNIPDDGYVPVSLPFTFPFYGRNFTQSYMFSNGVVGFLDPTTHGNGFCCDGADLRNTLSPSWNFAIYALQTDLIQANANAKFYTQGNSTYMKYAWENINEYGTQNLNTFSATIKPTGYIGIQHDAINVQYHNVTTGIAGDLSQGQYSQYYTGPGSTFPYTAGNVITFTGTEVADRCASDPLSSPTCPLYQATMCSMNPLFSNTCQGYTDAVNQCLTNPFTTSLSCPNLQQATAECNNNPLTYNYCPAYPQAMQQCSVDPLSNTLCPTYQLTRQCNINQLYSQSCSGYQTALQACSTNPLGNNLCPTYTESLAQCTSNALYASYCPGYQTAQTACTTNPLSNSLCTGYGMASLDCEENPLSHSYCPAYTTTSRQCAADPLSHNYCPGYATAYFNQQCSISGLYDRTCPNYAEAYKAQQCSINALFATDCPGYATAYFNQQCSLNALYDRTCPGYNEAYAKKMVLEQQGMASTVATAGVIAATAPKETTSANTSTSTSDGSSSVAVAVVADPVVNQAVTSTATSTSPAAAATATVSLAPAPAPAAAVVEMKVEAKQEAKSDSKQEEKKPDAPNAGVQSNQMASGSQGETKPAAPTARQELAAKREAAAKAEAVEKGKNLAKEMGKVADMESQKQVQNVVIQAMGFTPGFDAYGKVMVPDGVGYKPFAIYKGQVNVDNRRLGMGLYGPSDRLHNELVDSQYGN